MKAIVTDIPGVIIVEPQVFSDDRGWFVESYSNKKMESVGIKQVFVQDNHSFSAIKGTLRGLHFQKEPDAQTKLVRCTRGAIFDVAVDIRKGSPTYLKWISVELSAKNFRMLYIPKGFAHGFLTLENDTEVQYKVDNLYSKQCDRSIRFDDPSIGVKWGNADVHLSEKDLRAPLLKDSDNDFVYR